MKITRILSLAAAAAVALSLTGCSFRTGTNFFEDCITSIDLDDDYIVAAPKGEGIANADELAIDYLTFKKEYLYYLKSSNAQDDTKDKNAALYAQQREFIINYMVDEAIIIAKAKEMGLLEFTQEELDKLDADFQANLKAQYEFFGENADYGTLAEGVTISEEEKLARGKEEFAKYLADCCMTEDDLMGWQRNALIQEKMYEALTKDVTIEMSEAEAILEKYIEEEVKPVYESDPRAYETTGTYTSFWLPEGSRNIKHILIGIDSIDSDDISAMRQQGDEAGADALLEEKLAEIREEADEIINMLDNGADFDELIAEYSDDAAGSAAYPSGYTVIPNSVSYVEEFVEAAFSLENIGDYVLASTDFGWHIVMYASDAKIEQETLDMYTGYIHENLVTSAKESKYEETISQWAEEYAFEIDYEALAVTVTQESATTSAVS